MFARTMADVNEGEDAEIRRLERGAADAVAGDVLFEADALLDGTRGVVSLHSNRLEWISDGAAAASVQLEVAHVASFQQSKAGKPNPKLKVTATPAAGGGSFVFDMTEADPTSTAERDRLRETLKAQMVAVGLLSAAAGASGAARAAEATSEGASKPVFKSARLEGQDPENLIDVCMVGEGPYKGMELNVYELPETNLYEAPRQPYFYMHRDSRKKFPMLESYEAPRRSNGLPCAAKIRLKEQMFFAGTLVCANPACRRRPSLGHGTRHFVIDSTTELEPSKTARRRHGFHAQKIADDKAQILCTNCELIKTDQASPGAQGSKRRRATPLH